MDEKSFQPQNIRFPLFRSSPRRCYTFIAYPVIKAVVDSLFAMPSPSFPPLQMVGGLKRPPGGLARSARYRTRVSGLNVVSTETGEFRGREARGREEGRRKKKRRGEEERTSTWDLARSGGSDLGALAASITRLMTPVPVTRPWRISRGDART